MRKPFIAVVCALVTGALFTLISAGNEEWWWPASLEPAFHLLGRVIAVLSAPTQFVAALIGIAGAHPALWRRALSVGTAPLLYLAGYAFWRLLLERFRSKGAAPKTEAPRPAMSRRAFLGQGGALAAGAAFGGYGALWEPGRLEVRKYSLPIADLPGELDGLRIVQISDTHYGPYMMLDYLHHVIDRANALQPDLILLTGDYVHRTRAAIPDGVGLFARARAPLGIAAVLGNHDHEEDARACNVHFRQLGIPMLDNARLFLSRDGFRKDLAGKPAVCIAGAGDLWADVVDPARALSGVPAAMPRFLLSHNPDVAERHLDKGPRVDPMLSGHTHGGQVHIPGLGTPVIPSRFGQKYAGGLVQGPNCRVLISRGVGMAMLPVRVGVPPEIGEITLQRA